MRPWLLRIAANLARNRQRADGRRYAAHQRAARERLDGSLTPRQLAAQRETNDALWQAIRRLPEPDQQVIYLRYFLALTVAETAQAMDVAEGTVKSRLSRALKRLREVICEDYPELALELE